MDDPIGAHLTQLERSRYSDSTLAARERVLRSGPDFTTADRASVVAWWETRQDRPNGDPKAAATLSSEQSHVRAFCKWAMQQGLTDRNAADWLPAVRQKTTLARPVPEGDLYRIMDKAEPPMRQMIALAALAGLRSAEVAAAQWEDLDPGNGVLWVREGKGSKDRSVPLSGGLLATLGDPGAGPIIGKPMTAKAVSAAIGRHMRGVGADYTAHKLRARYATRFLAATGDLMATAQVLGHSSTATTARYTVASSDTMRRGAEAAGRIG